MTTEEETGATRLQTKDEQEPPTAQEQGTLPRSPADTDSPLEQGISPGALLTPTLPRSPADTDPALKPC